MIADSTLHEVIEAVLEQGQLTKSQIIETWAIDAADYQELQKAVLHGSPSLQSGPQGVGGFEVKKKRGAFVDEAQGESIYVRTIWERQAVVRLAAVLSHAQLEHLLGPLLQTVRRAREHQTGENRRGTKAELAAAVVLQRGVDLFWDGDVRNAVATACRVPCPKRWMPGKTAAVEFVRATDFPAELAGLPTPDSLPDFEYLEGRFSLHRLQDFQLEVMRELLTTLRQPGAHAIVTLPTGAGKTRVAVESIRDRLTERSDGPAAREPGGAVLWLAHTEELCEQAYACFKQVWEGSHHVCSLHLIRFWGSYTPDLSKHRFDLQHFLAQPSVLISTPQRMANIFAVHARDASPVVADLQRAIGVLVIDEAHRAAAPTYRAIIEQLKAAEQPVSVAGLTATPFRMEYLGDDPEEGTRELRNVFGKLIEPIGTLGAHPRQTLQDRGILARPVFEEIDTATRITLPNEVVGSMFTDCDIERLDRILATKTDNTQRRLAILDRLVALAADSSHSILYFGPSVNDAECMNYLLRRAGIPSAVVSGKTREASRRQIVADFKQRDIRVLCNCEVLTTGFDAPQVTHVVMARPTVSRVLYEQILGRGLRGPAFGGTETCVIVNCIDDFPAGRPPLGYESFRRVWADETAVGALTRAAWQDAVLAS